MVVVFLLVVVVVVMVAGRCWLSKAAYLCFVPAESLLQLGQLPIDSVQAVVVETGYVESEALSIAPTAVDGKGAIDDGGRREMRVCVR